MYSTTRQFVYNYRVPSDILVKIIDYYQTVWLQLYSTISLVTIIQYYQTVWLQL